MKKKLDIVNTIPGGWYGNNPGGGTDPLRGNVVVDPKVISRAIMWLSRRAEILETDVEDLRKNCCPGIVIQYKLKQRKTKV